MGFRVRSPAMMLEVVNPVPGNVARDVPQEGDRRALFAGGEFLMMDGASGRKPTCGVVRRRPERLIPMLETNPSEGVSSVISSRMLVGFPAPFGPRKPSTGPVGIERPRWSTVTCSPNGFVRSSASIAGPDHDVVLSVDTANWSSPSGGLWGQVGSTIE